MDFGRLLPPENTIVGLEAKNQLEVFSAAADLFEANMGLSRKIVLAGLLDREKLGSTALGHGIAIPHARIKRLAEATGALIKLKHAINFSSPDSVPVELLFVLLVPAEASELHLQILSELAQCFNNRQTRQKLLEARDAPTLYEQFLTVQQ